MTFGFRNAAYRRAIVAGTSFLVLLFLIRINADALLANFEARFGPLLTTQLFHPQHWFWAFDQTQPITVRRGFAMIIALFGGFLALDNLAALKSVLSRFFQTKAAPIVICLLAFATFWYFRVLFSWGDVGRYEAMLAGTIGVDNTNFVPQIFFMSAPLTTALFFLSWITGIFETAENAIAMVNVLAGVVYVWCCLRLVRLSENKDYAWVSLLLFVATPSIGLFFGYRETTSVVTGTFALYALASVYFLRTAQTRYFLLASLAIGVGAAAHNIAIILLPSWALLAILVLQANAAKSVKPLLSAMALIALPLALMFALAVLMPDRVLGPLSGDAVLGEEIAEDGLSVLLRRSCIGSEAGDPVSWCYPLGSIDQIMDILNLSMLLLPGWIILVPILVVGLRRNGLFNKETLFCLANIVSGIAFIVLFPSILGYLQDWDLYAPAYLQIVLFFAIWVINQPDYLRNWMKPLLFSAVAVNIVGIIELIFVLQPWLFGRVIFPMLAG